LHPFFSHGCAEPSSTSGGGHAEPPPGRARCPPATARCHRVTGRAWSPRIVQHPCFERGNPIAHTVTIGDPAPGRGDPRRSGTPHARHGRRSDDGGELWRNGDYGWIASPDPG